MLIAEHYVLLREVFGLIFASNKFNNIPVVISNQNAFGVNYGFFFFEIKQRIWKIKFKIIQWLVHTLNDAEKFWSHTDSSGVVENPNVVVFPSSYQLMNVNGACHKFLYRFDFPQLVAYHNMFDDCLESCRCRSHTHYQENEIQIIKANDGKLLDLHTEETPTSNATYLSFCQNRVYQCRNISVFAFVTFIHKTYHSIYNQLFYFSFQLFG